LKVALLKSAISLKVNSPKSALAMKVEREKLAGPMKLLVVKSASLPKAKSKYAFSPKLAP
jgi:hypothetical protein